MKKLSLLAAAITVALTGCGSDDDSAPAPASQTYHVSAIDGYLAHADVYANDTLIGKTDANGLVKLSEDYKNSALTIKAVVGQTIDLDRGAVVAAFDLSAPAGAMTISPITDLVVAEMQPDETGKTLTEAEAKNAVATQFATISTDHNLIFGDYLANTTTEAMRLKVIGETLVDNEALVSNKETNVDQLLSELVEDVQELDDNELEYYAPVIDNETGNVTLNTRPFIEPSNAFNTFISFAHDQTTAETVNLTELFNDLDGTISKYEITSNLAEDNQIVSFDKDKAESEAGELILTPVAGKTGQQVFSIIAIDDDGARSYALELIVAIASADNAAPEVDSTELTLLEDDLNKLNLMASVAAKTNSSVFFADLFTDEDQLTLSIENPRVIPGLVLSFDSSKQLIIDGTPAKAGDYVIAVIANDGMNTPVPQGVKVSVAEFDPATTSPTGNYAFTTAHFSDQVWKMGSFAPYDGEIGYAMLMKGEGNEMNFCWGGKGYKSNIDGNTINELFSPLLNLDKQTGYADYAHKDCWPMTLENGKLVAEEDGESMVFEMLYQYQPTENEYQIIFKKDDELFWLDSTDARFAQTLSMDRIKPNYTLIDMTVEDLNGGFEDYGAELKYATGEYQIKGNGEAIFNSITPSGLTMDAKWTIKQSVYGQYLHINELEEDQKQRYHYINRNFGHFHIGLKWTEEGSNRLWNEYGLYSSNKEAMKLISKKMPILQD